VIGPFFYRIDGDEQTEYINFEDISRVTIRDEVATIYLRDGSQTEATGGQASSLVFLLDAFSSVVDDRVNSKLEDAVREGRSNKIKTKLGQAKPKAETTSKKRGKK
jgi:hypothetical protein